MTRTRWIVIGLALAACQCESGPMAITQVSHNRCRFSTWSSVGSPRAHGCAPRAAHALQAAIAQGRLGDARDQAEWFATHDMDVPPRWQPYVDDMRGAARRIKAADDVASAGLELGRLGHACGSCHEAQQARVAQAYGSAPADGATLDQQMARHTWAAARLWQGIIGPTDELWVEGARVLTTTRFDILSSTHEKPNAEVIELAERLREQAQQAVIQTQHGARAQLYGEMMETCASCHRIVRPHPVARH